MIRDQQHVLPLHGKLIEQEHMASAEMFDLQGLIPRQERIGPWPCFAQVPGYGGNQLPQLKWMQARQLELPCFQWNQSALIQRPCGNFAGLPPEAFSSHRLGAWPELLPCSSDPGCR